MAPSGSSGSTRQASPARRPFVTQGRPDAWDDSGLDGWGEPLDPPVVALSQEQARALLAQGASLSVGQALISQALAGLVIALLWGLVSGRSSSLWSALYGAGVAVLPSAVMAAGVFGLRRAQGVAGLVFWELIKLMLVVGLLALAPTCVPHLDWLAMMVTLVVCLKVVGVALLAWQRREKKIV